MRQWRTVSWGRCLQRDVRASAIVEFALVVPLFFLIVWGSVSFARAYHRLDILTGSLREGARFGATLDASSVADQGLIQNRVSDYALAFGLSLAPSSVSVTKVGLEVQVSVVNYPLFSDLTAVSALSGTNVSRVVHLRSER